MIIVRQFPLKLFIRFYPEYPIPLCIDRDDEDYVVRFDDDSHPFEIEIGYPEDDWNLKLDT